LESTLAKYHWHWNQPFYLVVDLLVGIDAAEKTVYAVHNGHVPNQLTRHPYQI